MRILLIVLIVAMVYQAQAAKRVKMCDTNNAESPGKSIYIMQCSTGDSYKCLDGDASNKGKWQTCVFHGTLADVVIEERCIAGTGSKDLTIFAAGGTSSDGLCVEAIDFEDILSTFCDNVPFKDHIMTNSAGWCETFGWGALREYSRLWFDTGSGRCNGFVGTFKGSNGQEFLVHDCFE